MVFVLDYWGWIYAAIVGFAGILGAYFESHGVVLGQELAARVLPAPPAHSTSLLFLVLMFT